MHAESISQESLLQRTMVSVHVRDIAEMEGEVTSDRVTTIFGPNAKLMHRFYEPLQLLAILNAGRVPGEVDLPADPQSREARMIWRRFLDNLSSLCDNKHGGETVSAVAAQSSSEGNVFWLVSRYEQSFEHLEWVMTELKAVTDEAAVWKVGMAVAEKSILFSTNKIKNYLRFLRVAYRRARDDLDKRVETHLIDLTLYGA